MISKVCLRWISASVVAAAGAFYAPVRFAAVRSAGTPPAQAGSAASASLDYEFFKARVQPIFLKNRSEDHARCYTCHEISRHPAGAFHLEPLLPGATTWNEEQSRRNFQVVSQLVIPGAPKASFLLIKPLAPEAGGNSYRLHDGGRQFTSQDDPDWKNLSAWVSGQKGGK